MKVKDLIECLSEYDPDFEVIVQKDSEGNDYSPLAGAEVGIYSPDSTYSGEVLHPEDDDEEPNCVVLWPMN